MNPNKNLNTEIDDYSIDELLQLLEITEPTREKINEKINSLNRIYFKNDFKLTAFFYAVQNKLLNSLTMENPYIQEDIFPISNQNLVEGYGNMKEQEQEQEEEQGQGQKQKQKQKEQGQEQGQEEEQGQKQKQEEEKPKFLSNINYGSIDIIKQDETVMREIESYKYLQFNTVFRANNNPYIIIPATNSDFVMSTPVSFVSQIKLASINIKKPNLICGWKANTQFKILKYIQPNPTEYAICDASFVMTIDDGYYEDPVELEKLLNETYFYKNTTSISPIYDSSFLKQIKFSIDPNSRKIAFDLSKNYLQIDTSFVYYELDFASYYTPYYSLANIFGFDTAINSTNPYSLMSLSTSSITELSMNDLSYGNPITNLKITSPYVFSNKGTTELFFCFEEYQSNTNLTHLLFLNNNLSSFKILAKINCGIANRATNYYIDELFSNNDSRYDNIRKYDGSTTIQSFNVTIIDYYGNLVNRNLNEDFTFAFELKLNQTVLIT